MKNYKLYTSISRNKLKIYKPYTPSLRTTKILDLSFLTKIKIKKKIKKKLKKYYHHKTGRNNQGKITNRHLGNGHKYCYRFIDFKRNKYNIPGIVYSIEYDPNRNVNICLIKYIDGEYRYILHPENVDINDIILSKKENIYYISNSDSNYNKENFDIKIQNKEIFIEKNLSRKKNINFSLENIDFLSNTSFFFLEGNNTLLKYIPLGTKIHNIELYPKKGGQLVRSAGTYAKIIAKDKNFVLLQLPSQEIRLILKNCFATVGRLSNSIFHRISIGKAGRNRWLGIRPTVRGSAMNPIDHPHGGGEGRTSIGKKTPVTPWGKPTLGFKTRNKYKLSNKYIIKFKKSK